MNNRTTQDNDITLYSLAELKAMERRYNGNYKGWQPFTPNEVDNEIIDRETTPELIYKAKGWLKQGYSYAYIQSIMYASRDENTGIKHISLAINKAKQELSTIK